LIQKLITKRCPPLKPVYLQELISSAGLQPYEPRIQENLSAARILTTLGRVLKQKQKARTLDEQAEESLSFEPPRTDDAPKRRKTR
jgi:hypothetical protein